MANTPLDRLIFAQGGASEASVEHLVAKANLKLGVVRMSGTKLEYEFSRTKR